MTSRSNKNGRNQGRGKGKSGGKSSGRGSRASGLLRSKAQRIARVRTIKYRSRHVQKRLLKSLQAAETND